MSKKLPVIDATTGKLGDIDEAEYQSAIESGAFRPALPEDIQSWQDQKTYGEGIGNSLLAGTESAARSLTLGLSDVAARKLGLTTEEDQEGRAKYNPAARTVGEVAAFAGALLTPETAAAKVIGAVPKGVSAAGRLVSQAVSGKGAPGVLRKALSAGAGSAVEGGLIGASQAAADRISGMDDELTGEKLAAHIGIGALLGGALGSTGSLLGSGVSAVGRNAPEALKALTGGAKSMRELAAQEALVGIRPGKGVFNRGADYVKRVTKQAAEDDILALGARPEQISERAGQLLEQHGRVIGKTYDMLDSVESIPKPRVEPIAAKLEVEAFGPLRARGPLSAEVADAVERDIIAPYREMAAEEGLTWKQLARWKEDVGARLPFNKAEWTPAQKLTNDVYQTLKTELISGTESAAQLLGGDFANAYKKALSGYSAAKVYEKAANSQVAGSAAKAGSSGFYDKIGFLAGLGAGGVQGGLAGALAGRALSAAAGETRYLLTRAIDTLGKTAAIDSALQKVDLSMVRNLSGAIGTAAVPATTAGGARLLKSDLVQEKIHQVNEYRQNPEKTHAQLEHTTRNLSADLPTVSGQLNATAQRALNFLASKLPPEDIGVTGQSRAPKLSKSDQSRFSRYQGAIENPNVLFEQLRNGKVDPAALEAVKAVYPKIFESYQNLALVLMQNRGVNPDLWTSKKKIAMGIALGMPFERSLRPGFLGGGASMEPPQSPAGPKRVSEGTMKRVAGSLQTTSQRVGNRR